MQEVWHFWHQRSPKKHQRQHLIDEHELGDKEVGMVVHGMDVGRRLADDVDDVVSGYIRGWWLGGREQEEGMALFFRDDDDNGLEDDDDDDDDDDDGDSLRMFNLDLKEAQLFKKFVTLQMVCQIPFKGWNPIRRWNSAYAQSIGIGLPNQSVHPGELDF